jgi:hypothetical protein
VSDNLDSYMDKCDSEVGRGAVRELAKMTDAQLLTVASVIYQLLAIRSSTETPADIIADHAAHYGPTDAEWNGGVRSYVELNVMLAIS